MDFVIGVGIALCCVTYFCVGFLGYWGFGETVDGNILLSYHTSASVSAARVAISFLVAVSFPLMAKHGRDSFLSILRNSKLKDRADGKVAYVGFTLAFLGFSYIIAISLVNNPHALTLILGLCGGTTSTIIAYLVPTAVYVKLHPEPHAKRSCAIAIGVFGLLLIPFSVASTLLG